MFLRHFSVNLMCIVLIFVTFSGWSDSHNKDRFSHQIWGVVTYFDQQNRTFSICNVPFIFLTLTSQLIPKSIPCGCKVVYEYYIDKNKYLGFLLLCNKNLHRQLYPMKPDTKLWSELSSQWFVCVIIKLSRLL